MLKLLQSNFYRLFLLAMLCLGVNTAWGQTVNWDFASASPSTNAANITTSALTQGNNNGTTTITGSTSASTGYTGASGGNNAGAAAYTGTLNTSSSTYFQFTLTPATGYSLTVTQIEFGARSTSTGPAAYTIKNAAALSTDLATGTISTNSTWVYKTSAVSLTSSSAVTIRIYGHSGTGSAAVNTANWRIDDLKISVTATATNAAPTASSVVVSGADYNVGTTLTGSYTYADAESNPEGTSTFKWYTATDNAGTGAAVISGATATTFPLTSTQANKYIRFSVVPVASAGTTTGTETFSSWYGPVVNPNPSLTPTPSSLTGFTYVNNNGPSASQSFALSGANLTGAPGTITVTAPADYVVSTDNTNFGTTATISYTAATLSSTNVYVKLKAGLADGPYNNETVSISGGSATASVTVSGSVTNQAPTASNVTVSGANYIVGTTLTGSYTYADYESNPEGTSTYKWYTATDINGTSAAAISGATAPTFTLTSTQSGKYIRYSVIPVASAGTTTGVETFSAWYGPVVTPALAATPTSLTGFTYIAGNGPSAAQSFSVNGSNLNGSTVTATAPTNYEVSLSASTGYGSSVSLSYTGTTLNATTVYVRLKSGLATTSYTGSVSISGGGVSTPVTVSLTGTVAPANDNCSGATALTLGTTATSQTVRYASTSGVTNTCGGTEDDDVWYSFTTTAPGNYVITATPTSSSSSGLDLVVQVLSGSCTGLTSVTCEDSTSGGSTEVLTVALSGNTTYYVRIYDYYNATTSPPSSYTFSVNVTAPTPAITATPATIAFSNVESGTSSTAQQITVSGSSLNTATGNISLTTAAPFQVSTDGSAWSTTLSLPYTGYTLGNTTIYVKYNPTSYAASSGSIAISGGGATATVALTGTGILAAPVATTANPISLTTFNANWNASTAANDYRLDVATTSTFGGTQLSEDFSNFTAAAATGSAISAASLDSFFNSTGWTGSQVYDNPGDVGYAKMGSGANRGVLTTPTLNLSLNNGVATLNFDLKYYDSGTAIQVLHAADGTNFVQVGSTVTAPANFATQTYTITNGTVNSKIRIQAYNSASNTDAPLANKRFYLDNLKVTYSTILSAYNDITVADITKSVTGLTENTTYYYRVRAHNTAASATSANSNVITVTTGRALTWNGTAWTYGAVTSGITPTVADSGTIAGSYNTTANGNLTIGALTVQNGQSMVVAPNTTVTVANAITNNGSFTVQNNGALVQTNEATNSGNIVVIKNSNALYRLDYTMWSSPVTGTQTLADFSPNTYSNRYYDYDTTQGLYVPQTASTTTFGLAKGYLIRMPNAITADVAGTTNGGVTTPAEYTAGTGDYIYEGTFNGVPNNGTIIKPLVTEGNRFNATGNPYPSPISVVDFFTENSNVLEAGTGIYFWRKRNNSATSTYAIITASSYTFNSQNGSTTNGGGVNSGFFNMAVANWRIAPGQGFIIKANNNATNPQLKFTNAMRRSAFGSGVSFFKQSESMTDLSRFWLDLSNESGTTSQMSVAYLAGATTGIDYSYDAFSFAGEDYISIYTFADQRNLSIQTRPSFENTDVVPAGFNIPEAGTYTLTLANKDGVFENGQKIYLKDNQEGIIHNMDNPYTFTTSAGVYNNRFEIMYSTTSLGTDIPVANNVMVFKDKNAITINAGNTLINNVEVFDIRGSKLYSESNINATNFSSDKLAVENQVIIVKVNTATGTVSKKIIF
ncbi:T9SS sorting signal type C domain-containing protein [Flavobacterium sp. RHBU_3]|uniref:T9SS sorting signal type C domain-containing protein n=1 Tax=Flavobacterium sp. RHBU_3 TaxID=3391184 RepID=UPI003985421D